MPFKSQSMNLVHKTAEGTELWLGDYYAATNLKLLKQREIKSGTLLNIQFSQLLPCSALTIQRINRSIIK